MLENIADFVLDVVAFQLGRFYLFVLSLGQVKVDAETRHQPFVSLVGAVLTLAMIVGLGIWLNNG